MIVNILLVFVTAHVASARDFYLQNNFDYPIYVGILGNSGHPTPNNGGFELGGHQRVTVSVPDNWGGRFWGRTGCSFNGNNGHCETGDCGKTLTCDGRGGAPPATLAEITLQGSGGNDFYDISLVDGFNVPMTMRPTDQSGSGYRCTAASCNVNLNDGCPDNLRVYGGGGTVACKSSCLAENNDQTCCRGAYGTADACRGGQSAQYFEGHCPLAYSYAYDDATSTFTCANTNYEIIFG